MIGCDTRSRLTESAGNNSKHAATHAGGDFLSQACNLRALAQYPFATVRGEFTGDQSEQRGFAFAIAPEQTDSFTRLDTQMQAIQQRWMAVTQVDVPQGE